MPSAIETHDAMVRAYDEQRERVLRLPAGADVWTGRLAQRFREDPRRPLDPVLEAIAAYLQPEDVLLDVGGGAGRMSLPLALRCREVIDVDPSQGMREQFEAMKSEARIANARFVQSDWLAAEGIEGDVVLAAHVTFFVPDIRRFVEKLQAVARRRVVININSVPTPNVGADIFALLHGEPQALVPGYRQLLPALWEMGMLPDVRALAPLRADRRGTMAVLSREAAIESLTLNPMVVPGDADRLRELGAAHFDELFQPAEGGYVRRASEPIRPMLITWETSA
jgi:SAM-dependent methyltransferase